MSTENGTYRTSVRVIKNTGFLYAKMAITMFISLYTTRLILNALGAEDFGIFNIVGGAIAMLGFLNAAMAGATQRFMSYTEGEGNKEKQKSIFNISVVLHIVIALLMAAVLAIAGYFFFNGILNIAPERMFAAKIVYASLIISTVFTVMTVPYDAVLNAHENMLYYSIVGILESVLKLVVALLVVMYGGDKLVLYGILMAIIPLITMSIMRLYCHRKYEECVIAPRRFWNKDLMKEMTGFAGWNLGNTSVIMISAYGQGIILNSFFGVILNAAMGIAGQINGQLQILSSNLLKAINPILGKSAGGNDSEMLRKSTYFGAKYSTALYLFVAIPVFIEAPYILKLWLINIPEWTIMFVRFQLIKTFIEFQFGTLPGAIAAVGNIKLYTFWSVTFNLLQLPSIYLLFKFGLPPYFIYVATILFGNILVYIGALYFAKTNCNFTYISFIKEVLLPLYILLAVCSIVLYSFHMFNKINDIKSLILFGVISVITFILSFYFLAIHKNEQKQINSMVAELINKIKS